MNRPRKSLLVLAAPRGHPRRGGGRVNSGQITRDASSRRPWILRSDHSQVSAGSRSCTRLSASSRVCAARASFVA
ncbi:unnamed protein product [[Actinomadura] parvosata subsp. kistnae]|nr:unnamed protein product [Actinomadura parvosata subsp. kistnae]